MASKRRRARLRALKGLPPTAFEWSAYASRARALARLLEGRVLADTELVTVDNYRTLAHWQPLAALSISLLNHSRIVELPNGHHTLDYGLSGRMASIRVHLPDCVTGHMVRLLLECAYYGRARSLDRDCLEQFYTLSLDYQIPFGLDQCLEFACELVNSQNCIRLLKLAQRHQHQKLKRCAYSYTRANFTLLLHTNKDLHTLSFACISHLLADHKLGLHEDEELAWLAIIMWLDARHMTSAQIVALHSEMVSGTWRPPLLGQPDEGHANSSYSTGQFMYVQFYSPPLASQKDETNYDEQTKKTLSWPSHVESNLQDTLDNSEKTDQQLFELLQLVRFMRFRSVNAFDVILSYPRVARNGRLTLLVNHMKVFYIVSKRLPVDVNYLESLVPAEHLERIQHLKKSRSSRALRSMLNLMTSSGRQQQQQLRQQRQRRRRQNSPGQQFGQTEVGAESQEDELLADQLSPIIESQFFSDKTLRRAKEPRTPSQLALLIGGWQEGAVRDSFLAYDDVCDRWFKLNIRLPEPRAFHAVCSPQDSSRLFIFGGTDGKSILNSVYTFDLACDVLRADDKSLRYQFHKRRPMLERRCHLSGVSHNDGRIYALGGHNGLQRLRSAERYEPERDRWEQIAAMNVARCGASACSYGNKIFVAGGQATDQFVQPTVEFYRVADDTWTQAAPMIVPRMGLQLVTFRGCMFALGGANALILEEGVSSLTRTVERYEPTSGGSWSLCAPMSTKRMAFGALDLGNQLLVVGGVGGRRRLKSCEALRVGRLIRGQSGRQAPTSAPQSGPGSLGASAATAPLPPNTIDNNLFSWRRGSTGSHRPLGPGTALRWFQRANLPSKRSGFGTCVLRNLRNASEFTYLGSRRGQANRLCLVRQQNAWWTRIRLIRRRKLVRHLKIALVVTLVILLLP